MVLGHTASSQDGKKVTIGTIDSVYSAVLKERRDIWVYVPRGGQPGSNPAKRYPVVYLLDGDAHFSSVVGMIEQLSSVNGNMICPEMIVVGIPNTDRTRDLTPTHVDADPPYMDSAFSKTSGGGEVFIRFIQQELMPFIESRYPTQPFKMLIGHSFGGLTVMNTFIHHTNLFNAYICIDPSMWWDHQKLLAESKRALAERNFSGRSLYLGIANTMNPGMGIQQVKKDTSAETRHIRAILQLDTYFKANPKNGLKYAGNYYPNDTHGSVPLITEYDALRSLFDFYPITITNADYTDTSDVLARKLESHFNLVSRKLGYKAGPPEEMINSMGYDALAAKNFRKAEAFFSLNVANYPNSSNVYDSLGDYYSAVGDKPNAIVQYKKALSVSENAETRKKLEKLQ